MWITIKENILAKITTNMFVDHSDLIINGLTRWMQLSYLPWINLAGQGQLMRELQTSTALVYAVHGTLRTDQQIITTLYLTAHSIVISFLIQ